MMHWYQSPFKSIHDTGPTRVNAPGVRSKAVFLPCMDTNYNYVLVSDISYPSNEVMWAAFQKGDPKVSCTIQKHRQPGMGDDLTVADYQDAKNYAESIAFGDGGIDASSESYFDGPWNMLPQQVLCCKRRKPANVDDRSYAERTGFCGQKIEQVEEAD